MDGSFNLSGNPTLRIGVSGALTTTAQEIEVMMDTGFSGFLMLPLTMALPLGLILYGTIEYSLADNSKSVNLACIGEITISGKQVRGIISVANDGNPLLGMEFLKLAKMKLLVDAEKGSVAIEDSV